MYLRPSLTSLMHLVLFLCTLSSTYVSAQGSLETGQYAGHQHAVQRDVNYVPTFDQAYNILSTNSTPNDEPQRSAQEIADLWAWSNPEVMANMAEDKKFDLRKRIDTAAAPHSDVPKLEQVTRSPRSIVRRQNPSAAQLDAARAIVKQAQEAVGAHNAYLRVNPRRDDQNSTDSAAIELNKQRALLITNTTVTDAAALLAEADAEHQDLNGTLHGNYSIVKRQASSAFWLETVGKQFAGSDPFGADSSAGYKVFRNVRDYGAVGDGKADDTAAINRAISDGGRCGLGCSTTSTKAATIYFPAGTYLVSSPIIAIFNTQIIGNPNSPPVIKASPSFVGLGVITSDVYIPSASGSEWYLNTANFYRAVRNVIIDLSLATIAKPAGIHWQIGQATSLENIWFFMTPDPAKGQTGIFTENGSGGYMGDLTFQTGSIGIQGGNQQYTTRNLHFINCNVGIDLLWDWGWTFKSLNIQGAKVGINASSAEAGGAIYVLDSIITNTAVGIALAPSASDTVKTTFVNIENLVLRGVSQPVTKNGATVLKSGDGTVKTWVWGTTYDSDDIKRHIVQGTDLHLPLPMTSNLGGGPNNGYFERSRDQYKTTAASAFINAKAFAKGDGKTDDTAMLNSVFRRSADQKAPVYMPGGVYLVTDTVFIPPGAVIVGECWSQIMGTGAKFQDMMNPRVMVQVGQAGQTGTVEIQDLLFTVQGPTAGAVLLEWNLKASAPGAAAMWDSHFRVGGAVGSSLGLKECPTGSGSVNSKCIASSLMMHVTGQASGYFENVWAWTADHDLEDKDLKMVDVYSARGILIESQDPSWYYGTASEHSVLYQYQLNNAKNIFMSMIQTESAYFHPSPKAPEPFTRAVGKFKGDPDFAKSCVGQPANCNVGWALMAVGSDNIKIGGAGLYSWFSGGKQDCVDTQNCQQALIQTSHNTNFAIQNLGTIGSVEVITPLDSKMTTLKAADNTNMAGHPFLAAITSWSNRNGDNNGVALCDYDDDRPECEPQLTDDCDWTLSFRDLDALASASLSNYCRDIFAMRTLTNMLDDSVANYNDVNNGYDASFGYYVKYIKNTVPQQLSAFMSFTGGTHGPGNKYFDCTYQVDGTNHSTVQCPVDSGLLDRNAFTIFYHLRDADGFYKELLQTYGIDQSWVTFGDQTRDGICSGRRCLVYYLKGVPVPAAKYTVPNPKDIVTAALPNVDNIRKTFWATSTAVWLGNWDGPADDVVQTQSTAVFMVSQAIDNMKQVKKIGDTEKADEQRNLILEIIGAVLIFIPFLGEAAAATTGLASLARIAALIGVAGNTGLGILDIVQNPASAPMAILGILLGAADIRTPAGFGKMGAARRGMSDDDVSKVGASFKANSDKLENIVKFCKIR